MSQNLGCISSANGILYISIFGVYSINDNHNYNLSFVSVYEDTMYAIIKVRIFRSPHTSLRSRNVHDHTIYILIFAYIVYIRVHIYMCVCMCVCVCLCICICARIRIHRLPGSICDRAHAYTGISVSVRAHHHNTTLSFSLARLWQ